MPPLEQLVLLFGQQKPLTACLGRARLWAVLVISVLSGVVLYMIHPVDLDGHAAGEYTPEIINVIGKPYSKQIYVIGVCNSALSQTRVTNLQKQLLEWDFGMYGYNPPLFYALALESRIGPMLTPHETPGGSYVVPYPLET
mgnify:FL=1